MKSFSNRKPPHFFIINPFPDRRLEVRFESRCDVEIQIETTQKKFSASAYDIGQRGLRLQTKSILEIDTPIQVQFNETPENIRCFGRVVWSRPAEGGKEYECGVRVTSWQGIVKGEDSWKKYKGFRLKRDRRRESR